MAVHAAGLSGKASCGSLRPVLRWGLQVAWTGWAACAVALVLIILVDVKSVLWTGPIITVLGLSMVVLGRRGRYRALVRLGLANIGVCVLFFLLVVINAWQPHQATVPFKLMGMVYTLGMLPFVLWATRCAPRDWNPWACPRCDYLLYGLRDPRCPECGEPFDPSLLGAQGPSDKSTG